MKLRSNEVEHGYQLVFVRDWLYSKEFLQKVSDYTGKVDDTTILYVNKDKEGTSAATLTAKPFLSYQSAFK